MYFAASVETRYDDALALPRFTAGLVSAFSTLALVLAGVGIFGVTAYAVSQRTREFGIRLALGAQRTHVGSIVLRRVGVLAVLGIAIGSALGFGLGTLMSGLLFGVTPDDPATFWAALATIALTALAATVAPLYQAVRVESGRHPQGGIGRVRDVAAALDHFAASVASVRRASRAAR